MWCGGGCVVVVVGVVVGVARTTATHTSLLDTLLADFNDTNNSHRYTNPKNGVATINSGSAGSGVDGRGVDGSGVDGSGVDGSGVDGSGVDGSGVDGSGVEGSGVDSKVVESSVIHKSRHMHGSSAAKSGRVKDDGGRPKGFHKRGLRRLLDLAGGKTVNDAAETPHKYESGDSAGVDKWQCLMQWMRIHNNEQSKKQHRSCEKDNGRNVNKTVPDKVREECAPLLLLVIPSLCNGTQSCVNVTEASLEALIHRYFVWERKKKHREEANDAVVYIVVVLAFYSFGIVFMMANFVRQEQRELEETKMYKQYVKLARDRWLTTRGNLANKLALQALNTFNAVPQTTDVNKVTFV